VLADWSEQGGEALVAVNGALEREPVHADQLSGVPSGPA
jgi:hypothetical protein